MKNIVQISEEENRDSQTCSLTDDEDSIKKGNSPIQSPTQRLSERGKRSLEVTPQ